MKPGRKAAQWKESLEFGDDEERRAQAYRRVFLVGGGQAVLRDIIHRAGVLEFASDDPTEALRDEGARRMALDILGTLGWEPIDVSLLMTDGVLRDE